MELIESSNQLSQNEVKEYKIHEVLKMSEP